MAHWLPLNIEILCILFVEIALTVMEAMTTSLQAGLQDAWEVKFPTDAFSTAVESTLRTAIVVIVLIRAVSTHIYLASHLLIIIPLISERMAFVLIIWLVIAGLRSIIVNLAATLIGFIVCTSLSFIHPACFEFVGVKALELSCSTFLWVIVSRYHHSLGSPIRLARSRNMETLVNTARMWALPQVHWQRVRDQTADSASDESLFSLVTKVVHNINKKQTDEPHLSLSERSEKIASAAVYTFIEKSFGFKLMENKDDIRDEATMKFMEVHGEEIEKFILKIENYINTSKLRGKCIHKNCMYCQRKNISRVKNRPNNNKSKILNRAMYYVDYTNSHEYLRDRNREMKEIRRITDSLLRESRLLENTSPKSSGDLDSQNSSNATHSYYDGNSFLEGPSTSTGNRGRPRRSMTLHETMNLLMEGKNLKEVFGSDLDIFELSDERKLLSYRPKNTGANEKVSGEAIVCRSGYKNQEGELSSLGERRDSSVQTRKISKCLLNRIEDIEKKSTD